MSVPIDSTGAPRLDDCGCCEVSLPPARIFNRPGQPALAYRIDTQPTALRRMLAQLATTERGGEGPEKDERPLRGLTTRAPDDPAIALLDAWATVTDVLTFYQERIANEGYLRTATERRSVLELARAVGYELSPGVAASTFLAFTVEDAPGAPGRAMVPAGTKVQSIPGQGQLPQTFETAETIEARAEWNALRPQRAVAQAIGPETTETYLRGTTTRLQPGDLLLLVGTERQAFPGDERWDVRVVRTVTPVPPDPREPGAEGHTVITWDRPLGSRLPVVDPAVEPRVYVFRQRAALFGHNAPDWRTMPDSVKVMWDSEWDPQNPDRRRTQWPNFEIQTADQRRIDLDAEYPRILANTWLVLSRPGYQELYRIVGVEGASRTDFGLTAKTTRLELDAREHLTWFELRDTTVFAQSEELARAERPLLEPLPERRLVLDRLVAGLVPGRALVVAGRAMRVEVAAAGLSLEAEDGSGRTVALQPGDSLRLRRPPAPGGRDLLRWTLIDRDGFAGTVAAAPGALAYRPALPGDPTVAEIAFIDDGPDAVAADRERTTITLAAALVAAFDPATVTLSANVVRATHGESVASQVFGAPVAPGSPPSLPVVRGEVLGSGSGALANQQFALKRPPLTYLAAPTPSGARSTLAVRVNGALWQEVEALLGHSPRDEVYTVRIDADGTTRVIFGDGEAGARLPTGAENVTATYRNGIGLAGMVPADGLSLLQVRPLGVRAVTNPLPATGAADPESLADARANAPLTTLTLDRIVSLRDFEDFARAFAGIGKAQAVALWTGSERVVHVTVAGVDGAAVPETSDLYRNLVLAIAAQGDLSQRVVVAAYLPRQFSLKARLRIDPRRLPEEVFAQVAATLRATFAFDRRAFGQPATAAEVIAAAQGVSGVVAVDLDWLRPDGAPPPPDSAQPIAVLPAQAARVRPDGTIAPAELLLVNPHGIILEAMTT